MEGSGSLMTPEQFQQLMLLLGQVGSASYQATLKHVYVDAQLSTAWGVMFLLLAIASLVFSREYHSKLQGLSDSDDKKDFFSR